MSSPVQAACERFSRRSFVLMTFAGFLPLASFVSSTGLRMSHSASSPLLFLPAPEFQAASFLSRAFMWGCDLVLVLKTQPELS
jgi:hypothetical protein